MNIRLTWTGYDETEDYVVPNVLSPRDLISRPDNKDETVLHTEFIITSNTLHAVKFFMLFCQLLIFFKNNFLKKFRNTIGMSNSLDPDLRRA